MIDERAKNRNTYILAGSQVFGGANGPIVISLGGLVGQHLSSNPALATLPVSLYNVGLALGTLPAAYFMRRLGRRNAYILGAFLGISGGLIAAFGIIANLFLIFCLGTMAAGFYGSYVQSYRFAAGDEMSGSQRDKAISRVMVGGLLAAIIGPQLVIWTRDSLPGFAFAGSFVSQAGLALLAIPLLLAYRSTPPAAKTGRGGGGRRLSEILTTPRYVLSVAAGVVSYGLMTFVMTAAPIAMVGHGHSMDNAALGIQWHVLAMYAPSFLTGRLMARFGKEKITAVGLLLIGGSAMVALSGLDIGHFWGSLILLGIGWNFGFIGATAMVSDCHTPEERGKVQGANDFVVFGTVAMASFFSGSLMFSSGWETVNWFVIPAVALVLVPLVWQSARLPRTARLAVRGIEEASKPH
ncbi:major facilitator superfamily protein [Rhizobium etli bv. phaseoli str. IE4803]|nr:major facilitator superfamily protein [Rhizobium etli bv. phaseoli str. IE4803]